MIVNMPANSGSQTPFDSSQGQCEFNFLKRKLDAEDNLIAINSQQINNENGSSAVVEVSYQGAPNNLWKKRHLEDTTNINHATHCFGINSFIPSNPLNDFHSPTGNVADSSHNNNNSNSTDLTFNLIGSSFINDLFAYDANLIVPVPANLVSPLCGASTVATFSSPTSVCVNSTYDDGANWQATDLLELDHRYNSGLNTEITQLNPTVTLKATEQDNDSQQEQTHQFQQAEQSATAQTNFLVPQKQVSTRSATIPCPTQSSHMKYNRQVTNLSPQTGATQNDTETDFEDKNLSWLLNFKFDELPHLSPDVGGGGVSTNTATPGGAANYSTSPTSSNKSSSSSPSSVANNSTQLMMPHSERSRSPKSSTKAGKKFEELVMEVTSNSEMDGNEMVVAEHVIVDDSSTAKMSKKPPFTYTELIEYALEDKGELTVSGIYQWISDRFPYYKSNDDRWKNSVRHNLSINPHFRKGAKAPQGAGHLWTISSGDSAENVLAWEHKKQRLDLFFKMESMNRERLLQHQLQQQQQQNCTSPAHHQGCQHDHCLYDEAAAAAAAITQEMMHSTEAITTQNCAIPSTTSNSENQRLSSTHSTLNELPFNDLMSDEELRKTAGQILNGIHREVEVQSVNSIISTYHDVLLDNEDYLNPIHKDVAVNESGLRNNHSNHSSNHQSSVSQYYVTEIDPMELGIQMSHQVEEEVLFNDEFNLNYFGYNASNDIVA